ncbi:proline-rich protein 29-like [Chelmon rostratus]|uniref:proline-rich protein 29-like n=1 Tax=Chelmon rostratus TaxID=109905 RepID=UPI001BEC666F|nr:proline-rich protein 29-like [Chelmon rostratus]
MELRNGNSISYLTQAPQQPPAIVQQLPATMMPPGSAASIRPGGHVKEDLVGLMMIQILSQMHQVIVNHMTASALGSVGYSSTSIWPCEIKLGCQAPGDLVIIQENEADLQVYRHYYQPAQYLSYPAWLLHQATPVYQGPDKPTSPPRGDKPAVPPPPPPPVQHS